MVKQLFPICLLGLASALSAQTTTFTSYIEQAIENNHALKQQTMALEKSLAALDEARGMFLPSLNIEARYTRAGGGRDIIFPVGDLMNPVYGTLNELLINTGSQPRFPTDLPNETIPFLREEEQETKVRVIQPLFHPEIYYNYQIKNDLKNRQAAARHAFARELIADVKTAYFEFQIASQVAALYERTAKLVAENLRVSESLFENEKVTRDAVYRAQVEMRDIEQKQIEAENNVVLARRYFNFLLNRDLDTEIALVPEGGNTLADREVLEILALAQREEFQQVEHALKAANHRKSMIRGDFLPKISLVADYGIEGEAYGFSEDDRYWMASVTMSWNLFNGFRDKARYRQANLDARTREHQQFELEQKIKLQVMEHYDHVETSRRSIITAEARVLAARQSFEMVQRKYQEGMASHIEYLDARNVLTRSEIQAIIARYTYRINLAELERSAGLFDLDAVLEDE